MQRTAVDLLCQDAKQTIGGLWYDAILAYVDQSPQYPYCVRILNVLGDPTVFLRTTDPYELDVDHDWVATSGQESFDVEVEDVEGALCVLSVGKVMMGTALTDGSGEATIPIDPPGAYPSRMTLTVTAYNAVTYQAQITVLDPEKRCSEPPETDLQVSRIAPNPLCIGAQITYATSAEGRLRIELFDIAGRRVRVLVDGVVAAGTQSLTWNGKDEWGRALESGLYYYRIATPNHIRKKAVILIR